MFKGLMDRMNKPLFWAGIIGGAKLIANSFGYSLISDDQINSIANGLATIFVVVGVYVLPLITFEQKPTIKDEHFFPLNFSII